MAEKNPSKLNILLVGKTGVGKSSTGNSILKRKVFTENIGQSVTKTCREASATQGGWEITVIDTPGMFDTEGLNSAKEIDDYITEHKTDLHAICLVLAAHARPTEEEKKAIGDLCKLFGLAMKQYLIIVVTFAEQIEDHRTTPMHLVESFVQDNDVFKSCLEKNQVFGMKNKDITLNTDEANQENRTLTKAEYVETLINGIKQMVTENGGAMYTLHNLDQQKKKLEEEARKINARELAEKRRLEKERRELEALREEHNARVRRMTLLERVGKSGAIGTAMGVVAGVTVGALTLNPAFGLSVGMSVSYISASTHFIGSQFYWRHW